MLATNRLLRLVLLLVLGLLAIYGEAAPIGQAADAWPSPDMLFLVVAFFSVRRPGTALLLWVFLLGLARDLLTDTPVGIGALSLVAASEALKSLHLSLRRGSFPAELLAVAAALAGMLAVQWLVVVTTLLPAPPLGVMLKQWALTVALYPVLALVLRWLFRVGWRRSRPS